ncbi:MAG: hypothetical protein J5783_02890 [Lachnospiraceae bacterium]|nr:hypothetical protein [Lachnospiraceae bacterium]
MGQISKKRICKFILLGLIAVCLAIGIYLVIRLDVFNRIRYSEYKTLSSSKDYQEIVSEQIDSIELRIKYEETVTITDLEKIKEIVNLLDTMSFSFISSADLKSTSWDSTDIVLKSGDKSFRIGFSFYKFDYMYLFTDKRLYFYKLDREMKEVQDVFPWFSKTENAS